ncbi:hypothetical protein E3E22_10545 [Thermococcus sp. MV5]|uniref:hypothetical protein n=1 Tax=unclassified Thermococcus TaxID=2627626 RepID=UPI001430D920|nr:MULTISPECIES: hypothetical protein [unclassified Thermococcus]NJE27039.1 hypothetical protein [Thermococcus sp. MV5]NJE77374.1 hypothetical protein [Thermococcus sp. ES12]
MALRLIKEGEMLAIRKVKGKKQEMIKEFSIWNGFSIVYVEDLIEFMNANEKLIKQFLEFVLEKRKRKLEEEARKFEKLKEFVRRLK